LGDISIEVSRGHYHGASTIGDKTVSTAEAARSTNPERNALPASLCILTTEFFVDGGVSGLSM
jgi:hypothetical protein